MNIPKLHTALHARSLSLTHLQILHLLQQGPLKMSGIAEKIKCSTAAITGMIDRMEKKGLVERGKSASDRRHVLVQITPQGGGMVGEINGEIV